jgi:hypothetical protein
MDIPLAKAMVTRIGSTNVIQAWAKPAAVLAEATPVNNAVARPARDSLRRRSAEMEPVNWRSMVTSQ